MSIRRWKLKLLIGATIVSGLTMVLLGWLVLTGPDMWRAISAIPGPIRKVGKLVIREVQDFPYILFRFQNHGLPVYDIQISEKNLDNLNANLPKIGEALGEDNRVYVPAKFVHEGTVYSVDVRYRGDTAAHWAYPKKSMRIRFSKKHLFNDERMIDLIIPEDRVMIAEELNQFRARRLGMLTPNSRFVVVTINGQDPVVYWEAEHMTPEFLEAHHVGKDVNLFGDKYLYKPLYTDPNYWQKYSTDTHHPPQDATQLAVLLNLLNRGSNDEFYSKIFTILDKDSFYNWSISAMIADSSAQGSQHNMRLYVDPHDRKFKIANWDLGFNTRSATTTEPFTIDETDNPLAVRILKHPAFLEERNERLWQYVKDEKNMDDELSMVDHLFTQIRAAVYQDRMKEFSNAFFDDQVHMVRDIVQNNFERFRRLFTEADASCTVIRNGIASALVIRTRSLAPLTIEGGGTVVNISPYIVSDTRPTDIFLKSGGVDIQCYSVFRLLEQVKEAPISSDTASSNSIVLKIKNRLTEHTTDVSCKSS